MTQRDKLNQLGNLLRVIIHAKEDSRTRRELEDSLIEEELGGSCSDYTPMTVPYFSCGPRVFCIYEKGRPNGLYEEYDDDGRLQKVGTYRNGRQIGEWVEYIDGDVSRIYRFVNDTVQILKT